MPRTQDPKVHAKLAKARQAMEANLIAEADPQGVLDPEERSRRVEEIRRERTMARVNRSVEVRRARAAGRRRKAEIAERIRDRIAERVHDLVMAELEALLSDEDAA